MPYIEQYRRDGLDEKIDSLDTTLSELGDIGGDLNYVIYRLGLAKYKRFPKYSTVEQFVGTVTCARDEFKRRIYGPHEDEAIAKNGDIF